MGPTGEANFDIPGPSGPPSNIFSNAGVELTPDVLDNGADFNEQPLETFSDNQPSITFCKYIAHSLRVSSQLISFSESYMQSNMLP